MTRFFVAKHRICRKVNNINCSSSSSNNSTCLCFNNEIKSKYDTAVDNNKYVDREKVAFSANGLNFISVHHQNDELLFLIDSGASVSIIFEEYVDENVVIVDSNKNTEIKGISGSIFSRGETRLQLRLKDVSINHEFLIMKSFDNTIHGVLGLNLCKNIMR